MRAAWIGIIWVWLGYAVAPVRAGEFWIVVEEYSDCLSGQPVSEVLSDLIMRYDPDRHLLFTVVVQPAVSGHVVALRVVVKRTGAVIYERSLPLAAGDCPQGLELLRTVLAGFLRDTPAEQWQPPKPLPPPPPPVPEKQTVLRDVAELAGQLFVAASGRLPDPGADLELGAAIDVGSSSHRLIGSAALRAALPRGLGEGQFTEGLGLLGLGWRYARQDWMLRCEVRLGGLLVAGFGYPDNYQHWLLWLEGQLTMLRSWRGMLWGVEISVSPLRHQVYTAELARADLPWLRVGLVVGFPFWYKKF